MNPFLDCRNIESIGSSLCFSGLPQPRSVVSKGTTDSTENNCQVLVILVQKYEQRILRYHGEFGIKQLELYTLTIILFRLIAIL